MATKSLSTHRSKREKTDAEAAPADPVPTHAPIVHEEEPSLVTEGPVVSAHTVVGAGPVPAAFVVPVVTHADRTATAIARPPPSASVVGKRQTAADTADFIAACRAPITDAEHDATVAKCVKWTDQRRVVSVNYGPNIMFNVFTRKTKENREYSGYAAYALRPDQSATEFLDDQTTPHESIEMNNFMTPIVRLSSNQDYIGMTGDFQKGVYAKSDMQCSRRISFIIKRDEPDLPDTVVYDTNRFIDNLMVFQLKAVLPFHCMARHETADSVMANFHSDNEDKKMDQFIVKNSQNPDAKYMYISLGAPIGRLHGWSPEFRSEKARKTFKEDRERALAIQAAVRDWTIIDADPVFFGKKNADGSRVTPNYIAMMQETADREMNSEINVKKVANGFNYNRVMLMDFTELSAQSIAELDYENWVAYAVCHIPKICGRKPYNVPLKWDTLFLVGRIRGGEKKDNRDVNVDASYV